MRFLADMGVSRKTVQALRDKQHEVVHLSEVGLHRLADDQILLKAFQEKRIVLTFDLDFADLLASGSHKFPSVIIFRTHRRKPDFITERLFEVMAMGEKDLTEGSVVMVLDADYRVRHLPI
jgi:predicted nuclease of predicted toxin-antitoxin system